jgi:hypothetical protein
VCLVMLFILGANAGDDFVECDKLSVHLCHLPIDYACRFAVDGVCRFREPGGRLICGTPISFEFALNRFS